MQTTKNSINDLTSYQVNQLFLGLSNFTKAFTEPSKAFSQIPKGLMHPRLGTTNFELAVINLSVNL